MPKVTDIKAQVKNRDKVSVYIDGKYSFSLTLPQLADQKLVRVNSELSEEQVADLKKLSQFTKHYLRAVSLVYARPRSEHEIRSKLRLKKLDPEEIDGLIAKLTNDGYLNDHKFAEWWVNSRKATRSISTLKLKSELAQKGIKSELANEIIINNYNDEDEMKALEDLISKKIDKYETKQKLMTFLASKGFNYSQIKEALSRFDYPEKSE